MVLGDISCPSFIQPITGVYRLYRKQVNFVGKKGGSTFWGRGEWVNDLGYLVRSQEVDIAAAAI